MSVHATTQTGYTALAGQQACKTCQAWRWGVVVGPLGRQKAIKRAKDHMRLTINVR